LKGIVLTVAIILSAATASAMAGTPVLTDLKIVQDGEDLLASGRLIDGLTPEILEEIDAGLETTIDYRVRVYRRRSGWLDQAIAKHRIRCTVRHDSLTRQYTLTRRIDDELQETLVTPDSAVMREFLTVIKDVPAVPVSALREGEEYYLKARSDLGLMWRFNLIPWRLRTAWAEIAIEPVEGGGGDSQR